MINLKNQKRWKVTRNEENDQVIAGKRGVISLALNGGLDVWITNRRMAIKADKMWKAWTHYDDGAVYLRPFSDLDKAATLIKARKRRQVTEAMRQSGRDLFSRFNPGIKTPRQAHLSQEQNPKVVPG